MATQSETIDLQVDGQPMAAILARPDGGGPWSGIVVIMEAFGVNDYIKDVSRQLAEEGYIAIAPDFYHRLGRLKTAGYDDFAASRKMMATMRDDEVVKDASAALDYLKSLPECQPDSLGILGFWNGGRIAYLTTCYRSDVKALACLYGHVVYPETTEVRPVSPLDITDKIQAAVLVVHGKGGSPMNLDEVKQLEEKLASTGKTYESRIYDYERGFHNPSAPSYNAEAAKDVWSRVLELFKRHLG
jgi:carboxymethylenebutenolidase